jgi:hypothetical protein
MTLVRFAALCDRCGRRSGEYEGWPHCRKCDNDTCDLCDVATERTEDEKDETLCSKCAALSIDVYKLTENHATWLVVYLRESGDEAFSGYQILGSFVESHKGEL